jgi:predicted phosphodiesterase
MRVHVFSDLHIEFGPIEFPYAVRSGALAELVLLAGDIGVKRRPPAWAAATFSQTVLMVCGNHETYSDSIYASIAGQRAKAQAASAGRSNPVRLLERETFQSTAADGTPFRVIAATLWTDFDLFGESERGSAMNVALRDHNDFRFIRILDSTLYETRKFEPSDALRLHRESHQYLETELSRNFDGVTIVMTHHAPSHRSVVGKFGTDALSANYASNLEELILRTRPNLWVHGHLHNSSDYRVGATRVVCNPRGYFPDDLNPTFDPELVVEI